ncbi:oligosaccharide flippase family protein [Salinivibrio kushneri]|uniref:Oligosaccharide flippase family protein n=1 Tax=Salinivibrio kushneri TaxID=1908198 RepID=A0AA47LR55_9GAMM|nr:oligosaccharide flippase family protein [Salinivibrio kushneri]WBA07862.1 oligosaccharide flippase family protein [Salinivibrio kushneri]
MSLGLIDVVGMLIPIISMPIISRALGIELYGQYLLFMTTISFGHTMIDYGVQYTGVRAASKLIGNREKLASTYADYQGLRLILAVLYYIAASVYVIHSFESFQLVIPLGLYILGYVFTSTWFFQATGLSKFLSFAALSNKLVLILILIFYVKEESDFLLLTISTTLPVLITSLFLLSIVKKRFKAQLFSFRNAKKLIIQGKDIFIGILAPNLYNAIPIMVLGNISDKLEFAEFAISLKVCGVIFLLQNVLSKSVYPILSRQKGTNLKSTLLLNLIITIPNALILFFWGKGMISMLLGIEMLSGFYVKVISASMIFVACSQAFSVGYFLPNNLDVEYRNISLRASLISFPIMSFLIYQYSVTGGVLGLLNARLIILIHYVYFYRNEVKKDEKNSKKK